MAHRLLKKHSPLIDTNIFSGESEHERISVIYTDCSSIKSFDVIEDFRLKLQFLDVSCVSVFLSIYSVSVILFHLLHIHLTTFK